MLVWQGRVLTLLILLIMALQTSVMAIVFSKKDFTWVEAITAALGVVSNTAAIYSGNNFSEVNKDKPFLTSFYRR
ncbi:hypothetical protein WJX79_004656 [Trebouxia sp. C0005]